MEHTQKRKISKKSRKNLKWKKIVSENREIKDVEWEKQKQGKCRIDISEMKLFY
jgi:hypothetical protein